MFRKNWRAGLKYPFGVSWKITGFSWTACLSLHRFPHSRRLCIWIPIMTKKKADYLSPSLPSRFFCSMRRAMDCPRSWQNNWRILKRWKTGLPTNWSMRRITPFFYRECPTSVIWIWLLSSTSSWRKVRKGRWLPWFMTNIWTCGISLQMIYRCCRSRIPAPFFPAGLNQSRTPLWNWEREMKVRSRTPPPSFLSISMSWPTKRASTAPPAFCTRMY